MGEIVEMDGKGRIVIPKSVRDQFGLVEGSKLIVESDNNQVVLRGLEMKEPDREPSIKKDGGKNEKAKSLREFLSA